MGGLPYEAKQEGGNILLSVKYVVHVDVAICNFFNQIQYKLTSILIM